MLQNKTSQTRYWLIQCAPCQCLDCMIVLNECVDMKEMLANMENRKPENEQVNVTKEEDQETEVADVFGD